MLCNDSGHKIQTYKMKLWIRKFEFTKAYSTPKHAGWFTGLRVVALNISNLINPVHFRLRQVFFDAKIYGVLIERNILQEWGMLKRCFSETTSPSRWHNTWRDMILIWLLEQWFMSIWPGFFWLWIGTRDRSLWIKK